MDAAQCACRPHPYLQSHLRPRLTVLTEVKNAGIMTTSSLSRSELGLTMDTILLSDWPPRGSVSDPPPLPTPLSTFVMNVRPLAGLMHAAQIVSGDANWISTTLTMLEHDSHLSFHLLRHMCPPRLLVALILPWSSTPCELYTIYK